MLESRLISKIIRNTKSINQFKSSYSSSFSSTSLRNSNNNAGHTHRFNFHNNYSKNPCRHFSNPPTFHSLNKGSYKPTYRYMSTVAATASKENKEALKLLVTAGFHAQKAIGIWLFASAAWMFSMVVLGGVTRLTRSGLSMTDWKFTGSLPSLSEDDWLIEFEKYKQSPEFKRLV